MADICCMILCATYANLRSVGGTSYLPALGEGRRPEGETSGGVCPGRNVRFLSKDIHV